MLFLPLVPYEEAFPGAVAYRTESRWVNGFNLFAASHLRGVLPVACKAHMGVATYKATQQMLDEKSLIDVLTWRQITMLLRLILT